VHPQRAIGVAVRPRVKHQRPGLHVARHDDRRAELRLVRIARGREHCGDGRSRGVERRALGSPTSRRDLHQVPRQPGKGREQRLRLRIPEPAVELEHVRRAVARQHQPGVQHSAVARPAPREFPQGRLEHLATYPLEQGRRRDAHRAVRSHAAGVRPRVSRTQPLVVLRRRQHDDTLTVGERQDRQLFPLEELLHHDLTPRLPERAVGEHGAGGAGRCVAGGAHHGALAGGEPRGFDDEWLGVVADVGEGGIERVERPARGRGHAGAFHHLLGECLGGLDARRGLVRAEDGPANGPEGVCEAGGEWGLRPDDGEVDAVLVHRLHHLPDLRHVDVQIAAELGGARVPGRGEHGRVGGVALQRPAERVLAAAPADDQDPHFFRSASANAWAARFAVSTTSSTTALASFM